MRYDFPGFENVMEELEGLVKQAKEITKKYGNTPKEEPAITAEEFEDHDCRMSLGDGCADCVRLYMMGAI